MRGKTKPTTSILEACWVGHETGNMIWHYPQKSQYWISAVLPQMSFKGGGGGARKCVCVSQDQTLPHMPIVTPTETPLSTALRVH